MKKYNFLAQSDFVYRHSPVPVFVKAQGAILEDSESLRYFCADAANGTSSLGFDKTILEEAVKKVNQISSIPSFCETKIRMRVAERLGKKIERVTGKKGKVAFELGGAQGIELALKMVKLNNKKSQFVVFEGGYHGRSVYTSQLSASHRYRSLMGDWRIPIIRLPYPDYEQSGLQMDRTTWKKYYINRIEELVNNEYGGMSVRGQNQDIAAFIFEPLLNAGGIVKPEKEIIEYLVKKMRGLGALIVVDEIFTGFYRTGKMFGFQHYDISPDIIVMSKSITNGITPLSCIWIKEHYAKIKTIPPGTHSATFINQPLGLAIADTVLDRYDSWKTVNSDIKKLENSLNVIIKKIVQSSNLTISGFALGGVARILLTSNFAGEILDIARTVCKEKAYKKTHGLILASTGMSPNVVAINPPLNLTSEDLEIFEHLLTRTFEKAASIIKLP